MAKKKSVSSQLRRFIVDSGYSQYRLARLSGVPQSALSRFLAREGEGGDLRLSTVDRLAVALDLVLTKGGKRNAN
jgi:transcriptional regulator with XRE-family HTH domain